MKVEGTVYRGIGGVLTVKTSSSVLECNIRRSIRQSIHVGDHVLVDPVLKTVERVLPRRNMLHRPVVSNVDAVLIVFAAKDPSPSFLLMDRILVAAEEKEIKPILCINKCDLGDVDLSRYRLSGYENLKISVEAGSGMEALKEILRDRITVLAGPSGVGKSSITSFLTGERLRVSEVSGVANRGRHTTGHSEFFELPFGGLIVDSPGFGAVNLKHIERSALKKFFPEFQVCSPCRFSDCLHLSEPGCSVREAVESDRFPYERYESYQTLMTEVNQDIIF